MHCHKDIYHHRKSIKRKSIIYRENERSSQIYYLESGLVGLYKTTESGRLILTRVYGSNEYFGFRSLFSNGIYHLTARALEDSQIQCLSTKSIQSLISSSPDAVIALMTNVCFELGSAEDRLASRSVLTAKERILDAIIYLFSNFKTYPWTNRDVAEYSGTETQTVIRYIKELKSNGLLNSDCRRITPLDIDELIKFRMSF